MKRPRSQAWHAVFLFPLALLVACLAGPPLAAFMCIGIMMHVVFGEDE